MISVRANSRRIAYGVKQYTVDEEADLKRIVLSTASPGSIAFVLETSTKYVLNNKKKWIKIKSSSGGGSSSGSDEDYDGGSIDGTDPEENEPEYDGGSIDGTDPEKVPTYDGGSIDGTDPT